MYVTKLLYYLNFVLPSRLFIHWITIICEKISFFDCFNDYFKYFWIKNVTLGTLLFDGFNKWPSFDLKNKVEIDRKTYTYMYTFFNIICKHTVLRLHYSQKKFSNNFISCSYFFILNYSSFESVDSLSLSSSVLPSDESSLDIC